MICAEAAKIAAMDAYAQEELGIPTVTLMSRAGKALADTVIRRCPVWAEGNAPTDVIFCGSGNNGGDGYAMACFLREAGRRPVCIDAADKGQRSSAGQHFLRKYRETVGEPLPAAALYDGRAAELLKTALCATEALFGSGIRGELPAYAKQVIALCKDVPAFKLAVDAPVGVIPDTGAVPGEAFAADVTLMLSFPKIGLFSFPGRGYCGELVTDDLGLPSALLAERFALRDFSIDNNYAQSVLKKRPADTNKGNYGKLLIACGCDAYGGAALLATESATLAGEAAILSTEAALRGGCGLAALASAPSVLAAARVRLPDGIYLPDDDLDFLAGYAVKCSAVLVGCGSGRSTHTRELLTRFCAVESTAPLVIDADGLNTLADVGMDLVRDARRPVILTPHPLEFSRISGVSVEEIQNNRLELARRFAEHNNCVLVLKGAATVVASPDGRVGVNTTGSPALSKGGTGDVLAGLIGGLVAQGMAPFAAAGAAVYLHGKAGDTLADTYSEYGVLASDLPRQIAREIRDVLQRDVR